VRVFSGLVRGKLDDRNGAGQQGSISCVTGRRRFAEGIKIRHHDTWVGFVKVTIIRIIGNDK